ncbi:MAG: hypothetical protein JW847_06800 [Candidatus Omnitrophica bacterium]|nr:hypothetical protein [Candidatus Omnitrophota bacterium]
MDQRQKLNLIYSVTALLGIVLILGTVLILGKEHRFKKYHDKYGGFSISYPAAWSLEKGKGGTAVIFFSLQENDMDFFKESVNVVVQDISANPLDFKAYTELAIKQMELVFGENFVILESGPAFVAGRSAYKLIFLGKGPDTELKYMCVWLLKDVTAYQITYTALSSQYDRYIDKVKKMVNSFRID